MTEFTIKTNHGDATIKGEIVGATKTHAKVVPDNKNTEGRCVVFLIPITK